MGVRAEDEGGRARRLPWSRALLVLAVAGPPLWLGGVKPWVIPVFCAVVAGMLVRRALRSDEALRVPSLWWLSLLAAAATLLQWLPLPAGLLDATMPELRRNIATVLAGTELDWTRVSVHPGQTGLEFARLLGLLGLYVAAAQLSWRLVAAYVGFTGTAVALVGLVQKVAQADAIYGVYVPRQAVAGLGQELGSPLLTSFVNPNHQSGLLLVGMFAAAAMAFDLSTRALETRGHQASARLADRAYLAGGAVAIQATALVLSMSRAALLALLIVLPLAATILLRRPPIAGSDAAHTRRRRLALGAVVLVLVGLALSQGALGQLASLREPGAFEDKFGVAVLGIEMIPQSLLFGTGRGSFVDLHPLYSDALGPIQFTHLESTPVAFVLEWGPLVGGILVAGLGYWWWQSYRANAGIGRRLAMCGLLALAIQSCADFSLDYLGVSAAAVALAGALARSVGTRNWTRREVLIATALGLLAAEAVAIHSIPASWSRRQARDLALLEGQPSRAELDAALAQTPLDPFVHLAYARVHAEAGEWQAAAQRAEVAVQLRDSSLDAHLMAARAQAELGAPLESIEHLQRGLDVLREPLPPALVDYLIAGLTPEQLSSVAPENEQAWTALTRALAEPAPDHARALASVRAQAHPKENEPLRLLANLALRQQNPGLALHYARLLVAQTPNDEAAHRLRAHARFAHKEREQDRLAVEELDAARENHRIHERATIEELLVVALLRVGDGPSLERADALLAELSTRRADAEARARREQLRERLASAQAAQARATP